MRSLAHAIVRSLESGQALELVTVLTASGSTPRGPGAMLAVFSDGTAVGTVGGGNVEFEATAVAKSLLQSQQDALREFRLIQGDAASLGMVCGGDLTLHFQYLSADDASTLALFRELLEATGQNRDVWLVRRLDNEKVSAMDLADRDGPRHLPGLPLDLLENAPALRDGWFTLPAVRAGLLYIFGGGHVSQALVPVAATVGFRPFIYDDRPEFAAKARFPQAAGTLCGSFTALSRHLTITPNDYVVIMTRGHQADFEVLVQTLRCGARYLGCIGSRKKLALCRDRLLANGFTPEEDARVHAPIGLAIGAQTPEEIAVSVTAELIAVRAGVIA